MNLPLNKFIQKMHVRQYATYTLSVGITMLSGFLLVLILVRAMPAEFYGGLVLTKPLLLVVISVAGLGLSQAAVHWVGIKACKGLVLGTIVGGVSLSALPASASLLSLMLFFEDRLKTVVSVPLAIAVVVLVFVYLINNEFINWQRAQHKAGRHALLSAFRALLQLVGVVIGVLITINVDGYIYGLAVGELTLFFASKHNLRLRMHFSLDLLASMLKYGWPHSLIIASGFFLNYIDRYMISFVTDNEAIVAYYDAASMLVVSALALVVRPYNLFLFPAYTRSFREVGLDGTAAFVRRAQRIYLILGLTVSTIVIVWREQILSGLFPQDYAGAASIFAIVAYGSILNGMFMSTVAGLYISQKTIMIAVAATIAVSSNVLFNWYLIPLCGVTGAALSLVASNFIQLIVGYYYSHSVLPVKLPFVSLLAGGGWLCFVNWLTL